MRRHHQEQHIAALMLDNHEPPNESERKVETAELVQEGLMRYTVKCFTDVEKNTHHLLFSFQELVPMVDSNHEWNNGRATLPETKLRVREN